MTAVMALAVEAALVITSTGQAVAVTDVHRTAAPRGTAHATGPAAARGQGSALLMARLQNRRIEVLDARTDASQTFANPDGSLTHTAYAEPKWAKHATGWQPLDATLRQRPDGTVAPAAAESPLTLSGGGTGPLATMVVDGRRLTLSWPTALPPASTARRPWSARCLAVCADRGALPGLRPGHRVRRRPGDRQVRQAARPVARTTLRGRRLEGAAPAGVRRVRALPRAF